MWEEGGGGSTACAAASHAMLMSGKLESQGCSSLGCVAARVRAKHAGAGPGVGWLSAAGQGARGWAHRRGRVTVVDGTRLKWNCGQASCAFCLRAIQLEQTAAWSSHGLACYVHRIACSQAPIIWCAGARWPALCTATLACGTVPAMRPCACTEQCSHVHAEHIHRSGASITAAHGPSEPTACFLVNVKRTIHWDVNNLRARALA